jgi:hypothetical protein
MMVLRCRQPIWDTDAVRATANRHILCALLTCGLASTWTYAAVERTSGGDGEQLNDLVHSHAPEADAEKAKRDATRRDLLDKHNEATDRDSNVRNSAVRSGQHSAMLQRAGIKPRDNANRLLGAHANVSNRTVTVHQQPANRLDAAKAAARGASVATPPFDASRRVSGAIPVAIPRPPTLKALAGNGVIGGPRESSRGTLGGPAGSTRVINRSVDGTALRRRS